MSNRFLSADLRSIQPEDFKLQKPVNSDRRTEAQVRKVAQEENDKQEERKSNRSQLEKIIEEVLQAGRDERLLQTQPDPRIPAYMKELHHPAMSPDDQLSSERRTFEEDEQFSFEERRRPTRTEPDEPRKVSFLKKPPMKVEHFYLNLHMQSPQTKQPPEEQTKAEESKEALVKLSDVKVLMQCVLEKIGRSYRGDLRQYSGLFSSTFVSEMRSFLIGATRKQTRSPSVFSTPSKSKPSKPESTMKKQPTFRNEGSYATQEKFNRTNQPEPAQTERKQQRYFSNQIKRAVLATNAVGGYTRR